MMTLPWKNYTQTDRKRIVDNYNNFWPLYRQVVVRDPYCIWPHDWTAYMSPIERNVWEDIRSSGIELYPQVPCGIYFIDFANPYLGVAIEVDGKAWHQDKVKDEIRDQYLREHGYTEIIRIEGKDTYAEPQDDYNDEEIYEPSLEEKIKSHQIIRDLARKHRNPRPANADRSATKSLKEVMEDMQKMGIEPGHLFTMDEIERNGGV